MQSGDPSWHYLNNARSGVLWKVEGLDEYNLRRPRTATGTNLLGIVKHLAGVEVGYFGECLGRTWDGPSPWEADEDNADMWATADESPAEIIELYRRATAFADEAIGSLSGEVEARVAWWGDAPTTLGTLVVHVGVETARHLGQMDILREQADGAVGLHESVSNLPKQSSQAWATYVAHLESTARAAAGLADERDPA